MVSRAVSDYRDLEIWKRSIDLVEKIYQVTNGFPKDEQFGLISQMRRAAVSIASNIAEGYGRYQKNEFRQFLRISIASGAELITQLIIAQRLGFVEESVSSKVINELEQISKMIMSLIKKLK